MPIVELFAEEYRHVIAERVRQMVEEGTAVPTIEEQIVRRDGTLVDVEVSASPFFDEGEPAIHVVMRDITERKVAEAALAHREVRLEELLDERERNLEIVSRTLNSVIDVISQVVEMRDPYTAGHERRVAELALRIAEKMGMSPPTSPRSASQRSCTTWARSRYRPRSSRSPGRLSTRSSPSSKATRNRGTESSSPPTWRARPPRSSTSTTSVAMGRAIRGLTTDHLHPAAKGAHGR